MHGDNIFKIINLAIAWLGITLFMSGFQKMNDSGYTPPEFPSGWVMGMGWIIAGSTIAITWLSFMISDALHQKFNDTPRFSTTKLVAISFVLIFSAIGASVGTYLTWKHPLRLGPCDCSTDQWGPSCEPCLCQYGVCDSGQYGSGRCACDFGFAGDYCDKCDERHKPEPNSPQVLDGTELACDMCKTGYSGPELIEGRPKCDECDIGYTGEECDICDDGWQPWYHSSDLFPLTIAEDDRHLCDECRPNHWGYYCLSCPWGNDVPHITLSKNNPIEYGTRVADSTKKAGAIVDMMVYKFPDVEWTKESTRDPNNLPKREWIQTFDYNIDDRKVLENTKVKMKYDLTNKVSDWILFGDLQGVQCNNRGICMDDARWQALNPDWDKQCSFGGSFQECSTDKDCTVSENCKGVCQGIDPIGDGEVGMAIWEVTVAGKICSNDDDCFQPQTIFDPVTQTDIFIQNYKGGLCVQRGCCQESWHGNGECDCEPNFFGELQDNGFKELYELSPACDFCPGYDWLTENPVTPCSGGKGTCSASYSRTGEYASMRCTCGEQVYISPDGIVDPDKIIAWSGDLCECGDWDDDTKCDTCSAGHWGEDCEICPGGAFSPCGGLGKGECNSGRYGDGTCNCKLSPESSWMLAPYIKRYESEKVGFDITFSNYTCSECAPNFFGDSCLRCDDTSMIKPSELDDIFQPVGSYLFGEGQSSTTPQPICHRGFCTLACGGGGWCNWGRGGDGKCTCWSNMRLNSNTWNPLDNVCIGNDQSKESCPAYGYCSEGETGRRTATMCGTETWIGGNKDMNDKGLDWSPWDDWDGTDPGTESSQKYDFECANKTKGECYKWRPIDWRPSNSLITCVKDGN